MKSLPVIALLITSLNANAFMENPVNPKRPYYARKIEYILKTNLVHDMVCIESRCFPIELLNKDEMFFVEVVIDDKVFISIRRQSNHLVHQVY
jgi:hypothetical protein